LHEAQAGLVSKTANKLHAFDINALLTNVISVTFMKFLSTTAEQVLVTINYNNTIITCRSITCLTQFSKLTD